MIELGKDQKKVPIKTPYGKRVNKFGWFKEIEYTPSEGQMQFHNSNAKYKVLCAGTRFGKSMAAAREAEALLLNPGMRVWLVAPSYALGEKEFRYIHDDMIVKKRIPAKSVTYNLGTGRMRIEFEWGSFVEVKSAERAESLLGEEVDMVIMCEGSQTSDDTFYRYVWRAIGSREGEIIIPTTPAGYGGYVHEMWEKGQNVDNKGFYESWQFPTEMNPFFPKHEIEEAKRTLSTEIFEEQFLGKFVRYTGLVYSEFDQNIHVIDAFPIPKSWRREVGIDFGYTNPFCALWVAFDFDGVAYVYDEYYEAKQSLAYVKSVLWEKTADETDRTFNEIISYAWADPTAAQERAELDDEPFSITTFEANNSIKIGIERVKQRLRIDKTGKPRLYFFKKCFNLLKEIRRYHYPVNPDNKNRSEEPVKYMDHSMDALKYVLAGKPDPTEKTEEALAYNPDGYESTFEYIRQGRKSRRFA